MTANQINFRKALETERSNRENERIKEISARADESKARSAETSAEASRLSAEAADLKAQADAYNAKYGKSWIGDLNRVFNNLGQSIFNVNHRGEDNPNGQGRVLKFEDSERYVL